MEKKSSIERLGVEAYIEAWEDIGHDCNSTFSPCPVPWLCKEPDSLFIVHASYGGYSVYPSSYQEFIDRDHRDVSAVGKTIVLYGNRGLRITGKVSPTDIIEVFREFPRQRPAEEVVKGPSELIEQPRSQLVVDAWKAARTAIHKRSHKIRDASMAKKLRIQRWKIDCLLANVRLDV